MFELDASDLSASIFYDCLRKLNYPNQVLPNSISPLAKGMRLYGPAWPMSGKITKESSVHETLLSWTNFLSKAPAGYIIACQPNDNTIAHMGELSAETLIYKGVKGYIVDGGSRDISSIIQMNFPVFCKYSTTADVAGRWVVDTMGSPISIGGVVISEGDHIVGDEDGIVVVPKAIINETFELVKEYTSTENKVRLAIQSGVDPKDAYIKFGKF